MANTTNFNWETPDDTDLVKDGALAIRTLGSAIDTSLIDLKGGTTDQVLAKNSDTDMDFKWSSPGGGGKVLQVLQAEYTTSTTIATTTYTDTGISLSITPSAASSKILIISHNAGKIASATNSGVSSRIVRDSTSVFQQDPSDYTAWFLSAASMEFWWIDSMVYLDSPSTTSAITYKTQSATRGSQTAVWQGGNRRSTITLMEIGA